MKKSKVIIAVAMAASILFGGVVFKIGASANAHVEHLSNQEYDELKLTFSTAKEFKEKTFSLQEQQTFNMTGFYEFNTDVPPYESSTTVDFWDTMIIRFCDSERKISLDWQGVCYT